MSSRGCKKARVLPTSVEGTASLIQVALYGGQAQDFLRVSCGLGLFLFAAVERDLLLEPVRLEGKQALVHADPDAVRGEVIGIRAASGPKGSR